MAATRATGTATANGGAPTPSPRRGTRGDRILVALVALGAVIAAWSWTDGVGLVGGSTLAQVQALAPVIGVVGLLLSVLAMVRRRWVTALVAALASLALLAPVFMMPSTAAPQGSQRLSVLAINTLTGQADPHAVIAAVDAHQADVLVLPEMTTAYWATLQQAGLASRLPHATGRSGGGFGMVVATRAPSSCPEVPSDVTCGEVTVDTGDAPALGENGKPEFTQIVVQLRDGTRVKGVHLWSPRAFPAQWASSQEGMAQWIAEQPADTPLVLAGDFNAGPSHPVFRRYSIGLDHGPSGGFPWTRTWPVMPPVPPFTQVDHVLSHGWRITDSDVLEIPGSDHLGVRATLTR